MTKEIEGLKLYIQRIIDFSLPKYKELPAVELYMEQVLKYVNDVLSTLSPEQEKVLTSFMVNNYVKAKLIDLPYKKKYDKDQIAYLMAICTLKSTLSMADMGFIIHLDVELQKDKEKLYLFWSELEEQILKEVASDTKDRIDTLLESEEVKSSLDKDKVVKDNLALIALKLSIAANSYKLMADIILDYIKRENTPSKVTAQKQSKPTNKKNQPTQNKSKKKKTSIKKGELNMKGSELL